MQPIGDHGLGNQQAGWASTVEVANSPISIYTWNWIFFQIVLISRLNQYQVVMNLNSTFLPAVSWNIQLENVKNQVQINKERDCKQVSRPKYDLPVLAMSPQGSCWARRMGWVPFCRSILIHLPLLMFLQLLCYHEHCIISSIWIDLLIVPAIFNELAIIRPAESNTACATRINFIFLTNHNV